MCNRALSGQDAKNGKFSYYVCQSVMKRGSGACDAPRLNARRFEELVVGKIRENVLIESNIRELVRMVDEEMDGLAHEQFQRLQTIESELEDVKRRLGRLYDLAETTDLDIDDFKPRIRDHRERQEKLEASAEEARAILSQRREVLDDVETITAYALTLRSNTCPSSASRFRNGVQQMAWLAISSDSSEATSFSESYARTSTRSALPLWTACAQLTLW